ncbi:MAG: hypothetical protein ACKVHP_19925, partial [Verrucomicrobiales bacterium]
VLSPEIVGLTVRVKIAEKIVAPAGTTAATSKARSARRGELLILLLVFPEKMNCPAPLLLAGSFS